MFSVRCLHCVRLRVALGKVWAPIRKGGSAQRMNIDRCVYANNIGDVALGLHLGKLTIAQSFRLLLQQGCPFSQSSRPSC